MLGEQRPSKCRFGVGFAEGTEPNSSLKLKRTKQIIFVKSTYEKTPTENEEVTSNKGSQKNLYAQPIVSNTSWLKPKNRAVSCSGKAKNEKVNKTVFKQKAVAKSGESSMSTTKTKFINGKSVKVIQVWIPKGLICKGPI